MRSISTSMCSEPENLSLGRSHMGCLLRELIALVLADLRTPVEESGLADAEVVAAEQQFAVLALVRDEDSDPDVGLGAALVATVDSGENGVELLELSASLLCCHGSPYFGFSDAGVRPKNSTSTSPLWSMWMR